MCETASSTYTFASTSLPGPPPPGQFSTATGTRGDAPLMLQVNNSPTSAPPAGGGTAGLRPTGEQKEADSS